MIFEHYLLTRFSCSFFENVAQANLDSDYLKERLLIFEQYCFPSVKNQTCQNFKWLVLFDARTPEFIKKRMAELHNSFSKLIPCYLDFSKQEDPDEEYIILNNQYEDSMRMSPRIHTSTMEIERPSRLFVPGAIKSIITKLSGRIPEYYITSRLDNDDALHKDFIDTVQRQAIKAPGHFIFDHVYTYKLILSKGIAYRYSLENGHFISLMEPSDGVFQSVLYWNHLLASSFVQTKHIQGKTLQMEIIHSSNVVNAFSDLSITGMINAWLHFRKRDFGLNLSCLSILNFIYIAGSLVKRKIQSASSLQEILRRYFWPLPKFRKEMVVLISSPGHGGLTDRLRNILSVYSVCRTYRFPFKISYTYPCDLSLILKPAFYDWSIKTKDLSFNIFDSQEVYLWVDKMENDLSHQEWINQRHLSILENLISKKRRVQYHIHGNSYFAKGTYKELYFELFKPAPALEEKLLKTKILLPDSYEAVSLRFQNLLGDFEEYNSLPLSDSDKETLLHSCVQKIADLYDKGYFSSEKILVTSDSVTFLQKAKKELPFVCTIPGTLSHIDGSPGAGLEANLKSFVDFYALQSAKKVILLVTGNMYPSSFPEFCAEIGGSPFEIIYF